MPAGRRQFFLYRDRHLPLTFECREIVVHCKMGGRSAKAVAFLHQAGFTKVHNLAGGITAWSDRVDPKVPKY